MYSSSPVTMTRWEPPGAALPPAASVIDMSAADAATIRPPTGRGAYEPCAVTAWMTAWLPRSCAPSATADGRKPMPASKANVIGSNCRVVMVSARCTGCAVDTHHRHRFRHAPGHPVATVHFGIAATSRCAGTAFIAVTRHGTRYSRALTGNSNARRRPASRRHAVADASGLHSLRLQRLQNLEAVAEEGIAGMFVGTDVRRVANHATLTPGVMLTRTTDRIAATVVDGR